MPRRLTAAATTLAALLLTACSSSGGEESSISFDDGAFAPYVQQQLTWRGCGDGQAFQAGEATPDAPQCAYLKVPTRYAEPASGEQQLAVGRLPARKQPAKGVLVVNTGGPGRPVVPFVVAAPDFLPDELLETHDVVAVDPRATGESGYLSCLATDTLDELDLLDATPDDAAESAAWATAMRRLGESCLQRQPTLTPAMSSVDSARDVEVLRRALGVERLSVLGYSYGGLVGYQFARQFPTSVARLVLDSSVVPGVAPADDALSAARAVEDVWKAFVDQCVSGGDCPLGSSGDEVEETVDALVAQLEDEPFLVEGRDDVRVVTESTLVALLHAGLYDPWIAESMAFAVAGLADGDQSALDEYLDLLAQTGNAALPTRVVDGSFWATRCLDDPRDEVGEGARAAVLEASPRFGALVLGRADVCSTWPVPPVDAPVTTLSEDVAAVVVSSELDPVTPRSNASRLTELVPGAHVLEVPGWGHGVTYTAGRECVDSAVTRFLVDGDRGPAERGCAG